MTVETDAATIRAMTPARRREFEQQIASRVMRFTDIRPNWQAFAEARLPGNERGFYQYIGPGASDDPDASPVLSASDNFSFGIVVAGPGRGAPLHAHTTEEVFIALTGRWSVYWGEPGDQDELVLEPWDAVSVPAPAMRGFRNVGTGEAFLLALLGGGSPPPPIYHESVAERMRALGHVP